MEKQSILEWATEIGQISPEAKKKSEELIDVVNSSRWDISRLVKLYHELEEFERRGKRFNACL